jgi:predicted ester cyclase
MAQDNGIIVRGFVDEVITKGNIEAAAKYIWEDVIEQVPLPGQGPGLNGLKDTIRAMRAGFPEIVFSIHEQIAARTRAVFSVFRPRDALCASGGWSSTG